MYYEIRKVYARGRLYFLAGVESEVRGRVAQRDASAAKRFPMRQDRQGSTRAYRIARNAACTSVTNARGCSSAAKCPPRSSLL
jgi:hypothetical protein